MHFFYSMHINAICNDLIPLIMSLLSLGRRSLVSLLCSLSNNVTCWKITRLQFNSGESPEQIHYFFLTISLSTHSRLDSHMFTSCSKFFYSRKIATNELGSWKESEKSISSSENKREWIFKSIRNEKSCNRANFTVINIQNTYFIRQNWLLSFALGFCSAYNPFNKFFYSHI